MARCAREGCERTARGDEFCGHICAMLHFGTLEYDPDASKKRTARKAAQRRIRQQVAEGKRSLIVENPDAMVRRVPGSFGTGKRQ